MSSPKIAEKADLCQGAKAIISREADGKTIRKAIEADRQSVKAAKAAWEASSGKTSPDGTFRSFFIRTDAGYGRIGKRPGEKPLPQLYACKCGKLQELENQYAQGITDLYDGDESHVCTSGYVPYGWQFRGEDCHVPSGQKFRLNCFGIIDRNSNYDGFTTTESINSDKIIEYLDDLSFRIRKKTAVVPDNAKIHRAKKIMACRGLWEKRGLFIFFLPPYSPHLNLRKHCGEYSRESG